MAFPMGYGVLARFRAKAESEGSTEFSSYLAGQSAALGKPGSATALTERLVDESRKIFSRMAIHG